MKRVTVSLAVAVLFAFIASSAFAHFGMLVPDTDEVTQAKRDINLVLSFSHPFEGNGMELVKPERFFVVADGEAETDLLAGLQKASVMGHTAWKAQYTPKAPGLYAFAMVPHPYKEDAENNYIQHLTKVYVDAYGEGENWMKPLGLRTEIVPLTRPFGNYAGNVFQGQVLFEGKPAAHTRVEVEFYNKDGQRKAPNDRMVTQEVMADQNGVFTFACPWKGWWGFAALTTAPEEYKGRELELGAVIWLDMK
ncbi:DUF4198 domain-containing protein [Pseudodesulfovibrio senegalensis]|jgi:cobalt/nickel transport protein|uniref:DUF4198 domain-containing protein n=1 Tax=Pseudodesulfovibrio senegalensis TaxID=1721087 RepID=A0A6N6N986_9BACT|nr:DUF4198 domain-containing protein [Pseudodesulfovibrio senegalensis]KAB1443427.1 DUF4198 domain-containing protein [Pseudodesulfovibrio senegalensis]